MEARTTSVKVLTRCLTFDILLFHFYVFTRSFDEKNAKMIVNNFLHLLFFVVYDVLYLIIIPHICLGVGCGECEHNYSTCSGWEGIMQLKIGLVEYC